MTAVTIAVRRQVVDARVRGSERDALAVQRHLSGGLQAVVTLALEQALAGIVEAQDHLVVERLDIEVDELTLDALEDGLADAVRRETAAFFRRHLPGAPGPPASTGEALSPSTPNGPIVRRTTADTLESAFALFLLTGRLPWAFRPARGAGLERAVLEAWDAEAAEDGAGARRWEAARRALVEPVARRRVLKQFSPTFVRRLIRRLAPGVDASLAEVSTTRGPPSPAWTALVREAELAALAAVAHRAEVTGEQLLRQALESLPPQVRTHAHVTERVGQLPPEGLTERHPPGAPDAREVVSRDATAVGGPLADPGSVRADAEPDGPSWLVGQAGLVLLHPFLPRFLAGLGLATDDGLVDGERAVALLHHLATGETVVPEHEATVAKVLTGWPVDEPVERDPGLTPVEVAEATAVLTAGIRHWEALRNTSPDGLRAEFLARPGLLSVEGGDWVLRVEARSVDILLEQLPWGISMVRTPWMTRLMRVEWWA